MVYYMMRYMYRIKKKITSHSFLFKVAQSNRKYSYSEVPLMESGSRLLVLATVTRRERAAPAMRTHPSVSSGWTLEWVAVVKSHDCLHSVKIQPGGCLVQLGVWDEQGLCVQFSPSMRRLLRPRWGWTPCCSACLEAETTWTLPRCPSSSNPVLPPRN